PVEGDRSHRCRCGAYRAREPDTEAIADKQGEVLTLKNGGQPWLDEMAEFFHEFLKFIRIGWDVVEPMLPILYAEIVFRHLTLTIPGLAARCHALRECWSARHLAYTLSAYSDRIYRVSHRAARSDLSRPSRTARATRYRCNARGLEDQPG